MLKDWEEAAELSKLEEGREQLAKGIRREEKGSAEHASVAVEVEREPSEKAREVQNRR